MPKTAMYYLVRQSFKWMTPQGITKKDFFDRWSNLLKERRDSHARYERKRRQIDPEKNREICRLSYKRLRVQRCLDAKKQREKMKNDPVKLEAYRKYTRERAKIRAKTDIEYLTRRRVRTRIFEALRRRNHTPKSAGTYELIGCDIPFLRKHIESQFLPGMTWDNWGRKGWHIDHIRPCESFDLTDPAQQKQCFHYSNMQPLWWEDNLSKGDKFDMDTGGLFQRI